MLGNATAEKGRDYHKQNAGRVDSAEDLLRAEHTAIGLVRTQLPEKSGLLQTFPL